MQLDLNKLMQDAAVKLKAHFPGLSYDKILELAQHATITYVPKKEVLIKQGLTDKKIYIVLQGLFRAYYSRDGEDSTLWFRAEMDFFGSYTSILANKPSNISYQAIEDSYILTINYELLKEMAATDITVAHSIIAVLEGLMYDIIINLEAYILLSAEERFLKIMEERPAIINRVPQKHLASIIGIKAESLSRIKNRLMKK